MSVDLRLGDCVDVMATLPENSVTAARATHAACGSGGIGLQGCRAHLLRRNRQRSQICERGERLGSARHPSVCVRSLDSDSRRAYAPVSFAPASRGHSICRGLRATLDCQTRSSQPTHTLESRIATYETGRPCRARYLPASRTSRKHTRWGACMGFPRASWRPVATQRGPHL